VRSVATLPRPRRGPRRTTRAKRKTTDNMAAYECVLAARVLHHRSVREDNEAAQRLLNRAPRARYQLCSRALPGRPASSASRGSTAGAPIATPPSSKSPTKLEIALALDDNDSDVHRILAALNLTRDDHDKAAYHQERALAPQSQL